MIDDINNNMRAKCGFASVIKIETMELWDHMESFILSEVLLIERERERERERRERSL